MVTRATTFAVNNDEPSMLLKEFNKDGSRWQTVHVVRNDEIAEYTEKLGPTSLYEYGAEPGKSPEQWANAYHEERERREQGNRIWSPVTKPLL
jgi:hypothetical protein